MMIAVVLVMVITKIKTVGSASLLHMRVLTPVPCLPAVWCGRCLERGTFAAALELSIHPFIHSFTYAHLIPRNIWSSLEKGIK